MAKIERLEKDETGKQTINKTDLQINKAAERGIIHRDYLAHVLRWNHVIKHAGKMRKDPEFSILDVGCGKEFPLLRTLYVNKIKPKYYLGSDIRDVSLDDLHKIMTPNFEHEFQQCNFIEGVPECKYEKWSLINFLEVIEHVSKESGIQILENIKNVMDPDTILFVSTPCFNGKAAGNHVYEWEYEELKSQLEEYFEIEAHYGTFASQRDLEPNLSDSEKQVYDKLKEYYDSNFVSILMSPLYPQHSRNVIWKCKLKNC